MLRYIRLIAILFVVTVFMAAVCYVVSVGVKRNNIEQTMLARAEKQVKKLGSGTTGNAEQAADEKNAEEKENKLNIENTSITTEGKRLTSEQASISQNTVEEMQSTQETTTEADVVVDSSTFVKSIELHPLDKAPFFTWNNGDEVSVKKGYAFHLKTKVKPKTASDTPIEWVSDNEDVVKVLEDGKVCAKQCGTATVKAIASDPGRAEASITIQVKAINRGDSLLVAHRGKCDEAPENSLSAIELALQEGNADVEFDIWETLDHQFVVSHDESLLDSCGVDVKVTDLLLEEVMQYHITKGNRIEQYSDETIPSLKQVLETAKEYDGCMHIELKQVFSKKMLRKLRKTILKYGMEKKVKIITFSQRNISQMRELDGEDGISFDMEYLSSKWSEDLLVFCEANHVDLGIMHTQVDSDIVNACHERGIMVNAWTVNDFDEAYKMVYDYKVDAVTSDYFLFE